MATIRTLAVSVVAKTLGFQRGMNRSRRSLTHFRVSVRATSRSLRRFGGNLSRIILGGAGLYVAARVFRRATRAMYGLARSAEMFNRAMQSSIAIMFDVDSAMRTKLEREALRLARIYKFTAKELGTAYYYLTSAGLNAEQSLTTLNTVVQFAQAGMFDLSRATQLLTDAQAALGLKSKDITVNLRNMAEIADFVVKANTLADASTQQFAEALSGPLSGSLRTYKRTLKEGMALLAVLAERGVKGAEASYYAMILYRDIPRGIALNREAFKKYNIVLEDHYNNLLPLPLVIQRITNGLGKLGDTTRAAAFLELGFTRASGNIIRKLVESSGEMRDFEKALSNIGGTSRRVAEKQLTKLHQAFINLRGAVMHLGNTLQPLFDGFEVVVNMAADGVDAFRAAMGGLVPTAEETAGGIVAAFDWIGKSIASLIDATSDWIREMRRGYLLFGSLGGELATGGAKGIASFFEYWERRTRESADAMRGDYHEAMGLPRTARPASKAETFLKAWRQALVEEQKASQEYLDARLRGLSGRKGRTFLEGFERWQAGRKAAGGLRGVRELFRPLGLVFKDVWGDVLKSFRNKRLGGPLGRGMPPEDLDKLKIPGAGLGGGVPFNRQFDIAVPAFRQKNKPQLVKDPDLLEEARLIRQVILRHPGAVAQ